MHIRWFGQSAFLLAGEKSVFVHPFGDPGVRCHGRHPRHLCATESVPKTCPQKNRWSLARREPGAELRLFKRFGPPRHSQLD
jgi:hypothetical protein